PVVRPVLFEQPLEQRLIEMTRIEVLRDLTIVLFPMSHQVGVKPAGPSGSAFEERTAQGGEAPGHAAEKHGLADSFRRGREVPDMVMHEIRDRAAKTEARARRM